VRKLLQYRRNAETLTTVARSLRVRRYGSRHSYTGKCASAEAAKSLLGPEKQVPRTRALLPEARALLPEARALLPEARALLPEARAVVPGGSSVLSVPSVREAVAVSEESHR
jgi:hypothetical protein